MTNEAVLREVIARAIYELEPFCEGGEYVDGIQVSPGGNLSWEQACRRDAEFGDDPRVGRITEFAYKASDIAIAAVLLAIHEPSADMCAEGDACCANPFQCSTGNVRAVWMAMVAVLLREGGQ